MQEYIVLEKIIKKRRSIFPSSYSEKAIDDQIIMKILENSNYAPTHKKTEPWRYKVFKEKKLEDLGVALANKHKELNNEESFSEIKYNKLLKNPSKANCVIAICLHRNDVVPEWEEIAAVACSVQNMWLTCASYGIGAYWSSPKEALALHSFLNLKDNERCLGLFYVGYPKVDWPVGQKGNLDDKIEWM